MNKKYVAIFVSVLTIIALLMSAAVFSYAVYYRHAENGLVRTMAKTLPISAGRVGERTVLYRDYLLTLDAVRQFTNSPAAKAQNLAPPPDVVLSKNLFEHMLYIAGVEDAAAQRNITVSEEELRRYFVDVISAASSTTPDVALYLFQNYGWNEEDFRQKVLRPALLEDRLSVELSRDGKDTLDSFMARRMKESDVKRYLRF